MIDKIDHSQFAISRLVTQFKESPNLIGYIRSIISESDVIESELCDVLSLRTLDTATNAQLDVIGALVGQGRLLIDATAFSFFGFEGNPISASFGDINNPQLGGRFASIGESLTGFTELNDDDYRLFIRARIIRNFTAARPEDVINQIRFIFGDVLVVITEGVNASYQISLGILLSANQRVLIQNDLFLKPAGVQLSLVAEFDTANFFGFNGVPGAQGFGDINNPNVGGRFASLI